MEPCESINSFRCVLNFFVRVFDLLVVLGIGLLCFQVLLPPQDLQAQAQFQIFIFTGSILTAIVFPWFHVYRSWRGYGLWPPLKTVVLAWFGVFALIFGLFILLVRSPSEAEQLWLVGWGILTALSLALVRAMLYWSLINLRRDGRNLKRVVVVGAGLLGESLVGKVKDSAWSGFDVVAFFDDDQALVGAEVSGVRVYSNLDEDLSTFVAKEYIDEVWLALPLTAEDRIKEIQHILRYSLVNLRFVPNIFAFRLLNHSIGEIAGFPVLDLSASPMHGTNRLLKALEDRIVSLLILILISPILLVIAIAVKITSEGPIIFKQYRLGWDGRPIKIYKFRSMVVHQENSDVITQATKNDSRLTPIGGFLRRTSLDELPQFFNVLQGRMSIVGPRPHALAHNEKYKDLVEDYMLRHKVKPGITGWAQINGYRGETDTIDKMRKRVEYDLYYIDHWTLWLDLKIIVLTVFKGFINKMAY